MGLLGFGGFFEAAETLGPLDSAPGGGFFAAAALAFVDFGRFPVFDAFIAGLEALCVGFGEFEAWKHVKMRLSESPGR